MFQRLTRRQTQGEHQSHIASGSPQPLVGLIQNCYDLFQSLVGVQVSKTIDKRLNGLVLLSKKKKAFLLAFENFFGREFLTFVFTSTTIYTPVT